MPPWSIQFPRSITWISRFQIHALLQRFILVTSRQSFGNTLGMNIYIILEWTQMLDRALEREACLRAPWQAMDVTSLLAIYFDGEGMWNYLGTVNSGLSFAFSSLYKTEGHLITRDFPICVDNDEANSHWDCRHGKWLESSLGLSGCKFAQCGYGGSTPGRGKKKKNYANVV